MNPGLIAAIGAGILAVLGGGRVLYLWAKNQNRKKSGKEDVYDDDDRTTTNFNANAFDRG
jgi:uncharacterized protein HemX